MTNIQYEQPREKLAKKGAQALSNAELLQVIIGSGNAQISVTKIAKKVAKVLTKSGTAVHPQELLAIPGVGAVKAGQILATFELATRFASSPTSEVFITKESLKGLYRQLSEVRSQTILYVTFDGGNRVISKRQVGLHKNLSSAKQVQKLFADCLLDSAETVLVCIGYADQQLEPNLLELTLIRDVYKTSRLLSIPVRLCVLVSKQGERVMKELES